MTFVLSLSELMIKTGELINTYPAVEFEEGIPIEMGFVTRLMEIKLSGLRCGPLAKGNANGLRYREDIFIVFCIELVESLRGTKFCVSGGLESFLYVTGAQLK